MKKKPKTTLAKNKKRRIAIKKIDPTKISADNPEWTEEDFKSARPAREVLPELFGKKMADEMLKKRGRPKKAHPKVPTTIRLDADIVAAFRADGPGWQARINHALREWVSKH